MSVGMWLEKIEGLAEAAEAAWPHILASGADLAAQLGEHTSHLATMRDLVERLERAVAALEAAGVSDQRVHHAPPLPLVGAVEQVVDEVHEVVEETEDDARTVMHDWITRLRQAPVAPVGKAPVVVSRRPASEE